ncbi:MAG: hypothetical protein ACPW60_10205 [Methylohalobius sp. ZOD2]
MKQQLPNELLETRKTAVAFVRANLNEIEQAKANGYTWEQIAAAAEIGRHALKTAYHRIKKSGNLAGTNRPGSAAKPIRKPKPVTRESRNRQSDKSETFEKFRNHPDVDIL